MRGAVSVRLRVFARASPVIESDLRKELYVILKTIQIYTKVITAVIATGCCAAMQRSGGTHIFVDSLE